MQIPNPRYPLRSRSTSSGDPAARYPLRSRSASSRDPDNRLRKARRAPQRRRRSSKRDTEKEIQSQEKLIPTCPACRGEGSNLNLSEWCGDCKEKISGLIHPELYADPLHRVEMMKLCHPRLYFTDPTVNDGKPLFFLPKQMKRVTINGVLVIENGVLLSSVRKEDKEAIGDKSGCSSATVDAVGT